MVAITGVYQTDFARNWDKEGLEYADMIEEAVRGALESAGTDAADVGVIHVGNAFGQLFTGQGHLGAMPATVFPELSGKPAARHEAACASGSIAVLAAMADIESGRYDVALVLGAELERTVSGGTAAELMGAAAWVGHDALEAKYVWPWSFSELADTYDRRYGLRDEHLRAIGELNMRNAVRNPLAQTRQWERSSLSFSDDDLANPPVEGRLRRNDCSQVSDGAAALVLVRDDLAPGANVARITGWGHRTVGLALEPKLRGDETYVLPHVRGTITDAMARAGIHDVWDLDGIEVHDCFTPSEYMAIDHFGITDPGKSWQAIEDGVLELGARMPVNPSGGLIGGGHPVGATGVRMLVDAYKQVTGQAGEYQVEGAQRFATLNIGGSTATTVSFVVGA